MKTTLVFEIKEGWSQDFADWINAEIRDQGLKSFHKKAGISRSQLRRVRREPSDSATFKLIFRIVNSLGYELQLNIAEKQ
jgi:DNA-binding phage protein